MNKRIEEKAKDDRMSNHATFIAAKRQEITSLTAQIETKLTRQGDPAVAAVEAESMRMQNCRVQKRRRPWPAREIWKPRNSQPFTKQRSSMASPHRHRKSSCQTLDCGSREAFVVVSNQHAEW